MAGTEPEAETEPDGPAPAFIDFERRASKRFYLRISECEGFWQLHKGDPRVLSPDSIEVEALEQAGAAPCAAPYPARCDANTSSGS